MRTTPTNRIMSPEEQQLATLEQKLIAFKEADARMKTAQAEHDAVMHDFNQYTKQMAEKLREANDPDFAAALKETPNATGDASDTGGPGGSVDLPSIDPQPIDLPPVTGGGVPDTVDHPPVVGGGLPDTADLPPVAESVDKPAAEADSAVLKHKLAQNVKEADLLGTQMVAASHPECHDLAGKLMNHLQKTSLTELEIKIGTPIAQRIKELLPEDLHVTFDLTRDGETRGYAHVHASLVLGESFHLTFDDADFEPILDDGKRKTLTALMKDGSFKRVADERPGAYDDATAFDGGSICFAEEPPIKRAKKSD